MAIGVTDISEITDRLLGVIRNALNVVMPGVTTVSGSMPEAVRGDGGCQVSFYLYQVSQDKHLRNSPVTGPDLGRQRPLGLELFYLLTTFNGKEYIKEQQALTVAIRALNDTPYLRLGPGREELSVTMETETIDKLGILWQAVSTPFRLTAIYRVGIAFLAPPDVAPPPAPKPTSFTLVAAPVVLPFPDAPSAIGTAVRISYLSPNSTPAAPLTSMFELSPATVAPGGTFQLLGSNLNLASSGHVYLANADGSGEVEVTAWKHADPTVHTVTRTVLTLPGSVGAMPASAPAPGVYQIRAGGATPAERTNATPLSIAPRVDVPSNPPHLAPAGGLYTIQGAGFMAGSTELLLETIALAPVAAAPAAGEFQVASATTLTFRAPAILAPGRYGVRVRVNGVESAPSWWIVI